MLCACETTTFDNVQGFNTLFPNVQQTYSFQWSKTRSESGIEKHVLQIVDMSTDRVVFRDDQHFRGRDVNVAGWSATPDVLLAYSGDVGTFTIGRSSDGKWIPVDFKACLGPEELNGLAPTVADRLPKCSDLQSPTSS